MVFATCIFLLTILNYKSNKLIQLQYLVIFLELDKLYGEIESSIIQEEIQIMIKLSELITQHWIGDLYVILKLIAELDW